MTEQPDTDETANSPMPKPSWAEQVDWPVVKQKASAITATALCLITFMFVAGASVGTTRADGALNVLLSALIAALPWAALTGVISVLILMRRYRRNGSAD